jgi:hypothetical protein
MKTWKIGLIGLGLVTALGCGDDSTTDEGAGTNAGDNGGASAGQNAGNGGGADTGNGGGSDTNGNAGTSAGSNAGTSAGSNASAGGNDEDAGADNGGGATGACTNDADMAIIDAHGFATLGCEGAACATDAIAIGNGLDETKLATCFVNKAPNLGKLSAACQQCFVKITSCVPSSCVSFPGVFSGTGDCPTSTPPQFSECANPPEPTEKCNACQMSKCAPAFTQCSGLSM